MLRASYLVEDINGNVIDWCHTLSDAKNRAKQNRVSFITKLLGCYFGEGFHKYKLIWNGKVFKYVFRK